MQTHVSHQLRWFYTEKKPGAGEDAEPIAEACQGGGCLLAVFDGLGGAGSKTYQNSDGISRTGAYIASRLARDVFHEFFAGGVGYFEDSVGLRLKTKIQQRFKEEHALLRLTNPESQLKSKLSRTLPTTAAAVYFTNTDVTYQASVIWAGDSQVYMLSPDRGLQLISTDEGDADSDTTRSTQDRPMKNVVSHDSEFQLHFRKFPFAAPAVLIAATDGCYGYLPTQAHLENLLLSALAESASFDAWIDAVKVRLEQIAGDDATMAVGFCGTYAYEEWRLGFRDRTVFVRHLVEMLDEVISRQQSLDANLVSADECIRTPLFFRRKLSLAPPSYGHWTQKAKELNTISQNADKLFGTVFDLFENSVAERPLDASVKHKTVGICLDLLKELLLNTYVPSFTNK